VFTGTQAKKLKLVDELGTLEDAVNEAAKQAKIKGKPRVAYPTRKSKGLQDLILGAGREEDETFEEEHSFIDRIVAGIADRVTGIKQTGAEVLPAGLYAIWNGAR
jgi:ClpP class serine protease